MRLTIIRADGAVYKDSLPYTGLDLSNIPANVHALQWYETEGEIEFNGRPKPQNELISELPDWAITCVNKWDEAKIIENAEIARQQAQIANNQPRSSGTQTA